MLFWFIYFIDILIIAVIMINKDFMVNMNSDISKNKTKSFVTLWQYRHAYNKMSKIKQ